MTLVERVFENILGKRENAVDFLMTLKEVFENILGKQENAVDLSTLSKIEIIVSTTVHS